MIKITDFIFPYLFYQLFFLACVPWIPPYLFTFCSRFNQIFKNVDFREEKNDVKIRQGALDFALKLKLSQIWGLGRSKFCK